MSFQGKIPAGQRRAPREAPHDLGVEAPGSQQRGLYGDAAKLVTWAGIHVGEDGHAVGPRPFARLDRRHLHQPTRDGRYDQLESSARPIEAWSQDGTARPTVREHCLVTRDDGP